VKGKSFEMATWRDGIGGDLRHGIRIYARSPGLTALVVLTLSLGIGANAAIYSVFEAVLLRPLPYPAADRLVVLLDGRTGDRRWTSPTIPELLEVRSATRQLDRVTYFDTRDFQITGGDEPQRIVGARIETGFLPMLGVTAAVGRVFSESDGHDGSSAVVVLGHGLWRRNFGGDPGVIGRTLSIDGTTHEIIGVLPDTFAFGYLSTASIDVYVPYPSSAEYSSRSGEFANVRRVSALARLAPGARLESALAELGALARAMAIAYPAIYGGTGATADPGFSMSAEPLRESFTRNARPILLMLLAAVVVVLCIACVNAAQFLLAHAIEREPELALRSALGASRGRLVRQFVCEALLLSGVGGMLGTAQAVWLTAVLRSLMPRGTPVIGDIGLDARVLGVLSGLTLLVAVACVLVPAFRFSRPDLSRRLAARGGGASRERARHALIAVEVALSVLLLVGAGLLMRSLQELSRAQGGFSSERVTSLRLRGLRAGPALGDLYSRYLAGIGSIDGIEAAGMTSAVLPGRPNASFTIVGETTDAAALKRQQASYQIVSAGYFAALGVPLESGRLFSDDDATGRPPAAIVNREMAERFWPGGTPLGRQIRAGEGPRAATMTIVGIVGNVRPPFQTPDVPQLYVSYRQQSEPNAALIIRTAVGRSLPLAQIKQAIWSVEPRQAVFAVTTLTEQLAQATANQRAIATLLGGFATLALIMSVCGIYTVISYLVSRRIKEIAVRRAIGATSQDVLRSLAGPTVAWTLVGLTAGAAAAVGGSRVLRTAVSGLIPLEPSLMIAVPVAYLVVVTIAIAAAARGALRIEPAVALRAD